MVEGQCPGKFGLNCMASLPITEIPFKSEEEINRAHYLFIIKFPVRSLAFSFTFRAIKADSAECPALVIFRDTTPTLSHTSYSVCCISIRDHRSSSLWERRESPCEAKPPPLLSPSPAAPSCSEEPFLSGLLI